jgi:hypothetical protein
LVIGGTDNDDEEDDAADAGDDAGRAGRAGRGGNIGRPAPEGLLPPPKLRPKAEAAENPAGIAYVVVLKNGNIMNNQVRSRSRKSLRKIDINDIKK